jgi:methylphosphotriester-DNA--protein-cysteine methyltransferase
MTPKAYAQLWRFHRFVSMVQADQDAPDWAGIAAVAGFYDQPHVIRAFRRFSGWTPAEYHRRVAEFGPEAASFVPLDEIPVAPA